jgi:hypothetical protein
MRCCLSAVALFKFFQAAARARVIAAHVFQWIAHWLLVGVAATWAMHMAVIVAVRVAVIVLMIVLAIWAVNVRFLLHGAYSGM